MRPESNLVTTAEEVWARWCAFWPHVLLHHVRYLQSSKASDLLPSSPCHHLALLKRPDRRNDPSVHTLLPHGATHTFLFLWFQSSWPLLPHYSRTARSVGANWAAPNWICREVKRLAQGQLDSSCWRRENNITHSALTTSYCREQWLLKQWNGENWFSGWAANCI